ncbi:MAG: hypothetical protein CMD16_02675 [Flavobacteriales bacterium]|nr:hypothetical protein [Flavobacteriales bacterium]|tara:strand:- start:40203 stop:40700 length:498 start_codon:yes stop_codon:yes gene_type:complete
MRNIIYIIGINIVLVSCGIYSFTGASIPADAKTVSVEYITTKAGNTPASLNQIITEGLKDIFLAQTSLDLTENQGDLSFSGQITKYQIKPMAIKANESAAQNRLTIGVKIKYNNSIDNEKNFESLFNRYRDFDSSENLADVEEILIEEITKELIEDIFNKAFVNW